MGLGWRRSRRCDRIQERVDNRRPIAPAVCRWAPDLETRRCRRCPAQRFLRHRSLMEVAVAPIREPARHGRTSPAVPDAESPDATSGGTCLDQSPRKPESGDSLSLRHDRVPAARNSVRWWRGANGTSARLPRKHLASRDASREILHPGPQRKQAGTTHENRPVRGA